MATKRKKATKKKATSQASPGPRGSKQAKRRARGRPRVKAKRPAGQIARPEDGPREITVFDPDGVEAVLDVMPADDELQSVADLLQGMAHPSRLKALIALGEAELCVGDVAALVGLSLSATSTMLKQLRSLGYLSTRSAGKQTYYKVSSDAPRRVLQVVFSAAQELE